MGVVGRVDRPGMKVTAQDGAVSRGRKGIRKAGK